MNDNSQKYFKLKFLPGGFTTEITPGSSILEAIKKSGLEIQATCGGEGTCGDCIVKVVSGKYKTKPTAEISENLIKEGYVLSCSTMVEDDLVILIPKTHKFKLKDKIDSINIDETKISGFSGLAILIKKYDITVPEPTLDDNYSDLKRVQRELQKITGIEDYACEYSVLKKLASRVRESDHSVSAIIFNSLPARIIDLVPGDKNKSAYGLAIDIGTTTVALALVDLRNGNVKFTKTKLNLQRSCGEEIISRINYSQKSGGMDELNDLVYDTIHSILDEELSKFNVKPEEIYYASVAGNTTMIHLFLKMDPSHIRQSPYVPTLNNVPVLKAHEIGLKINPEARVYCAPSVGSYVGGDITAGLLCTPLLRDSDKVNLFIDIGTNGELVIGNKEWMITCACSAGPAFEGSGISCGMPASVGAIEKIKIKANEIEYQVIGDSKPRGICGSGIVDLLAELFVNGMIERSGRFNLEKCGSRISQSGNGPIFMIEKGINTVDGNDIFITENDIQNLIRTKGAIYSACSLLLKNVGLSFDEIDAFYIAGGFGKYLDIENAIRIGLFPDINREKFSYLGNTSLSGAYLILINDRNRELVKHLSEKMTYLELNTEPDYMNEYMGALFIPHTDMELFPSLNSIL
jgi:uncharacterized 2Fe-2S/4Fe-4S cluster protein (DUF4445 family)